MSDRLTTEALANLTARIAAAAISPALWQDVMDCMARLSGGVRTHFFGHDRRTRHVLFEAFGNYDPEAIRSYMDYYWQTNPKLALIGAKPIGLVCRSLELIPASEILGGEFYDGWMRPQEDAYCGGGTTLFRDPDRFIFIGGDIRARDQARLEDNWCRLVGLITPHLQHALTINRTLDQHRIAVLARDQMYPEAATFVLGPTGQLLHANERAEALVERGSPIGCDTRGKIFASGTGSSAFVDMLAAFAAGHRLVNHSFSLRSRDGTEWRLRSLLFEPGKIGLSPLGLLGTAETRCLLLVLSEANVIDSRAERIAADLNLTQSEAIIALSLADGQTLEEIAARRDVSIHTVRNQVKSALSKTGCRRQAELVAEVLRRVGNLN